MNGVLSPEKCINTFLPQGSILVPNLFLIYTNSLSKLQRRALDYLHMMLSNSILISQMTTYNRAYFKILTWCQNGCTLNIDKSSFLFIVNKNKNQYVLKNLVFNNQTLKNVNVIKYLGLYIDQCMTWKSHINHIQNKIAPPISILKRLSYTVPAYILI